MTFNVETVRKRAILKSIVDTFKLLVLENKILGFITLRYGSKGQSNEIIKPSRVGCFWNVFIIILTAPNLILEIYITANLKRTDDVSIYKITNILFLLAALIYLITSCTCGILHTRKCLNLLYKIVEIDHKFQYFKHGPLDLLKHYYGDTKRTILYQFLARKVFLILFLACAIGLSYNLYRESIWSSAMRYLLVVKISSINHLMLELIKMIKHRFVLINQQLVTVVERFNKVDRHSDDIKTVTLQLVTKHDVHKLTPDYCGHVTLTLVKIGDLHHQLSKVIRLFNETFGLILLVTFGVSFVDIVLCLFFLAANLQAVHLDIGNTALCILITVPFIFDVVYICGSCYGTIQEANRSGELIHKIECENHDVIDQIEMFSLQIANEKNEFSASGFFPVDYTLLFSIIGGVTTYIIILIQLSTTVVNQ